MARLGQPSVTVGGVQHEFNELPARWIRRCVLPSPPVVLTNLWRSVASIGRFFFSAPPKTTKPRAGSPRRRAAMRVLYAPRGSACAHGAFQAGATLKAYTLEPGDMSRCTAPSSATGVRSR